MKEQFDPLNNDKMMMNREADGLDRSTGDRPTIVVPKEKGEVESKDDLSMGELPTVVVPREKDVEPRDDLSMGELPTVVVPREKDVESRDDLSIGELQTVVVPNNKGEAKSKDNLSIGELQTVVVPRNKGEVESKDDLSMGDIPTVVVHGEKDVESRGDFSTGELPTMQRVAGAPAVQLKGKALSDRYEDLVEIGHGGFAVVFKARDRRLHREVVVKRLHFEQVGMGDEIIRKRFEHEAHAIAALNHPNIVQVYDYDRDADGHYIVMEYVKGGSLKDLLKKKGKLEVKEAVRIVRSVCEGLSFAHRKNLIHRDIKPANILLAGADFDELNKRSDLTGLTPKVADFGLARAGFETGMDMSLSTSGMGMGTPYYMPPEQRENAKGVNHTADIYAVGKTLYALVTGAIPDSIDPDLIPPPPELAKIIFKCIKSKPEDRFFSMDELIQALNGVESVKKRKGRRGIALVSALTLFLTTGYGIYRHYSPHRVSPAEQTQIAPVSVEVPIKPEKALEKKMAPQPPADETKARVNILLEEARNALRSGNLDDASNRIQSVFLLAAGNIDARLLLGEIERKQKERKEASNQKEVAELALKNLNRDITDQGQGFDQTFDEIRQHLSVSIKDFENKNWKKASAGFTAVGKECVALKLLEKKRKKAAIAKEQAMVVRKKAEKEKSNIIAKSEWGEALATVRKADELFEKGMFEEAERAWKNANNRFQKSTTIARDATGAYQSAKMDWEHRISNLEQGITREQLLKFGGTAWTDAMESVQLGEKSANDPIRGRQYYETALEKYDDAFKKALPFVPTKLKVLCAQSGVKLGLRAENGQPPPQETDDTSWELNNGEDYTLAAFKKGYKIYRETLTADWHGLKRKEIVLEKSKFSPEKNIQIDLGGREKMEFVWVPALKGWVGKFEVTNGEYQRYKPSHNSGSFKGYSLNKDRQPVVQVSWENAHSFIRWMKQKGELPAGYKLKLPSKTEWMTVAQCGDRRPYPWGKSWPPEYGNYSDGSALSAFGNWTSIPKYRDGYPVTCLVERSGQNDLGVYGLGGNVMEWTDEKAGGSAALRGASWIYYVQGTLRNAFVDRKNITSRDYDYGFRLFLCP